MKICVANRDNIVNHFELAELKDRGVEAIELYIPVGDENVLAKTQRVADAGFEPVVHLTGPLGSVDRNKLLGSLRTIADHGAVKRLVIHPVEGRASRHENCRATSGLIKFLIGQRLPFKLCLENLPFDPLVPERFGDSMGEVSEMALVRGSHNCFDTGHYLSKLLALTESVPSSLVSAHLRWTAHVHVHAFVNGQDHHPLQDDTGLLLMLLRFFQAECPEYDGFYSIEVVPFGHDPRDAILGSIDWLQTNFP